MKIGLSAPFEGLYRDLGYEALYAVRLAVRQRNEAGGVGGRWLVEMVALNDLNEPAEAGRQAAEMAVDPDVLGVLGGLSPRTAGPAAGEYERASVPFVSPAMNADKLGRQAARVAASSLSARTVMILHDDDAADRSMATGFAVMFANEGGEVLAKSIPQGKGDVAGLLSGLRQIPDVLFLAAETSSAAEWIKAAREAGFDGTIVGGPEVGSALTVDIAGPAGEGVLFVSPFALAPDDPAFQSAYETLSGGVAPGPVAAWCYAAARDMLDAMDATMRTSKQPWRPGVSAALASRLAGEAAIAVYVIRDGQVFTPAGY